jgi:hypothetical protein
MSIFYVSLLLVPRVLPEFSVDIRAFCTTCYDDHNSTREMLPRRISKPCRIDQELQLRKHMYDELFIMID